MTAHTTTGPGDRALVVGGGPVGLTVACGLIEQGLRVRVVERAPASTVHSRAVIMWPRSLELLRPLGVADRLAEVAHHIDDVSYWSGGKHLGSIEMNRLTDTPYPFGLCSPQHRTESVLRDRLVELGGTVETDTELVGLDNDPDGPVARLRGPGGNEEEYRTDWLVGADGARSAVRGLLDIEFRGTGQDVLFAIADGPVDGDLPEGSMLYCYRDGRAMGLAPFGDGTFRVACAVPVWDDEDDPPRELFQDNLDRVVPFRADLGELSWTTVFRARRRTAATFRAGRTFLVGDAAHIFSAAGSQGMNTGLQDAVNLAWRLGTVVRRTARPAVLDDYDHERRHSAERVSQVTAKQTEWGLYTGRGRIAVRDVLVRATAGAGLLQRWVTPLMSQLSVDYASTSSNPRADIRWYERTVRSGERLPAFAGPRGTGDRSLPDRWATLPDDRFGVVLWPGRGAPPAGWQDLARRMRAELPATTEVVDVAAEVDGPGRDVLARFLPRAACAAVVRPDGHLAALERTLEPAAVVAALSGAGAATPASSSAREFAGVSP